MQHYGMVFLDVDGTLLDSSGRVPPQTKGLLTQLEKRGIPLILSSARSPGGVEAVAAPAGIHGPIVCYGGGLILDAQRNILSDTGIRPDAAVAFKTFAAKHFPHVTVSAYLYNVWLVDDKEAPAIRQEAALSQCEPLEGDLQAAVQATHVHKLLCIGSGRQLAELQEAGSERFPELIFAPSKGTYLEVMDRAGTKGNAVRFLQTHYNVCREEIVALGDHFVDVDMLRAAGLGIAMENAPEAVKAAAERVTASNDREGVYLALKDLCFCPPAAPPGRRGI